jgi:hypothetical protein
MVADVLRRAEVYHRPKPQFGDVAREMGEAWEDEGPGVVEASRAKMQELLQRKYAEDGGAGGGGVGALGQVRGKPLDR